MKPILLAVVLSIVLLPSGAVVAEIPTLNTFDSVTVDHSGRTDRSGCHRDRKHGGRHCH